MEPPAEIFAFFFRNVRPRPNFSRASCELSVASSLRHGFVAALLTASLASLIVEDVSFVERGPLGSGRESAAG